MRRASGVAMNVAVGRAFLVAVLAALLAGGVSWGKAAAPAAVPGQADLDEAGGRVATLVTEGGRVLLQTGLRIHPGDGFIDPAGDIWTVTSVEGDRAIARLMAKLAGPPVLHDSPSGLGFSQAAAVAEEAAQDVVVYHTHSDESYRPTDGAESAEGRGGIYSVGAALTAALEQAGIRAVHQEENHNPHDHGAYGRSRRTLLRSIALHTPAAAFDIHRDAAPAGEYAFQWEGVPTSRIMIVIGRSNPAHQGNVAFARLLKARVDELVPGLMRGIFLGRGNYNQDTLSRSLLLEIGSADTPRPEAERGIALFAAAVGPVLRDAGQSGSAAAETEGAAATRNMVWLGVLGLALALGGLVLISGGLRPARERLADWRRELWDPAPEPQRRPEAKRPDKPDSDRER